MILFSAWKHNSRDVSIFMLNSTINTYESEKIERDYHCFPKHRIDIYRLVAHRSLGVSDVSKDRTRNKQSFSFSKLKQIDEGKR